MMFRMRIHMRIQRKPHESTRYRGSRHLPPPRRLHPDHPLSPLGYKMSNGTSQTMRITLGGFVRYRGENHPSHMPKHGECHVPTCHSGEKWMASSATAESPPRSPLSPLRYKMSNGTSQTNNADNNGWLRPQPRRRPPPIRHSSKWLVHGTSQKASAYNNGRPRPLPRR